MMTIRVLIADPHRMFHDGLKRLLEQAGDLQLVDGVVDAEAGLRAVAGGSIDVAVIATQLPPGAGGDAAGIDAIERIRGSGAATRCVALSVRGSRRELEKAMGSGASAFMATAGSAGELIEAIRVVHSGRCYVSPSVAGDLLAALGRRADSDATGPAGLTAREQEVLELIAEGHSSRQIAQQLGVSTRTVDNHRVRFMGKLGVRKTAGLVRLAVREGLVAA